MPIYELRSENLTNLGGPMGTESTYTNWRRLYSRLEYAKTGAERDYGKPIEWVRVATGACRSPDLGHVMYHIKSIKIDK